MTYDKSFNYCSYAPRKLGNVDWNPGCYEHDIQYRNEVKKPKTRKQADKNLRDYIQHKFNFQDKERLGFWVSRIYYYVLRLVGWIPWILWRLK